MKMIVQIGSWIKLRIKTTARDSEHLGVLPPSIKILIVAKLWVGERYMKKHKGEKIKREPNMRSGGSKSIQTKQKLEWFCNYVLWCLTLCDWRLRFTGDIQIN